MIAARSLLSSTAPASVSSGLAGLPQPHIAHAAAKKLRDKVVARYDEASGLAFPAREGINARPDSAEVWDDTAVLAAPEFASRIQSGIFPNFSKWATFVAGLLVPEEERPALAAALEPVDDYLFEMVGSSNFTVEINEVILDLALGTGCIRIDEAPGTNPFNSRAVPLRSLAFGIGPDGRPDPISETRKGLPIHIPVMVPGATLPPSVTADADTEIEFVEIWQRDWSKPTETVYRRSVYLPSQDNAIILEEWENGDGCCPYITSRWSKASGEGWGRGPLTNCLGAMRKCNYVEKALIDHTELELGGLFSIEDDGAVNIETLRLDPGTMVPRAAGSAPPVRFNGGTQFDLGKFVLDEARLSIRKALFTEQLGAPKGTPMSATEVTQRMTELARAIGSPFARLILELVIPSVLRFVRILKDRKLIALPEVNGKEIKLLSTSQLARVQDFETAERIERYLASMGAAYGPAALNIATDITETSHELGRLYGVPSRIIRPKDQQAQMIQQVAASVGGSANGEAAPGGAPGEGGAGPGPAA